MKSTTSNDVRDEMLRMGEHWRIPFFDFVDEFRRSRSPALVESPLEPRDERFDALLVSTIECLCDEQGLEFPDWVWPFPGCKEPWFVSGIENLKAIAIVESPLFFRRRKIFVLENFLDRV